MSKDSQVTLSRPLLSIVIPTKDRYFYLKQLIELLLGYNSDELEIVIQDNTYDNHKFIEYQKQLDPNIVRYFHESKQLTISENSDRAILNSRGKYVCFLGDDDGTTPEIFNAVKWMENNNIDAAICSPVYYRWPDAYGVSGAELRLRKYSGLYQIKECKKVLKLCMKDGFTWRDGLPGVYHGIVSRRALDMIYRQAGTFFPGASPDIANCIAVCLTVEKYLEIDYPIIINGAGKSHGGGDYRADISLRKLPFLPEDIIENWEDRIPKAWTATTIWCESSVKALKRMGRYDLLGQINYNYMYSVFISLYPRHRKLVSQITNYSPVLYLNLFKRYLKSGRRRLKKFLSPKHKVLRGINNIHEAVNIIMSLKR